jgi:ribosomal protein S18 acetylase RimI-like enzyme
VNEATIARHSAQQAGAMLETIADLYMEIRAERQVYSDPLFSRPSFIERTVRQMQAAGFTLVSATTDDTLIGFSFGYPFPLDKWWADSEPPSQQVLHASKFAVIELDVQKGHRGQGLGKILLSELLANRSEDYATLAVLKDSAAQEMYMRWGWRKIGEIGGDGPIMDAMIIPLKD